MSNFDLSVKLFPQLGRLHRDKVLLNSRREMCLQIIQSGSSPNFIDDPDGLKYVFAGGLMWTNCKEVEEGLQKLYTTLPSACMSPEVTSSS